MGRHAEEFVVVVWRVLSRRCGIDGKIPYGKENTRFCSSTQTSFCALAWMNGAQNYGVLTRFERLFGFKCNLPAASSFGLRSDPRFGDFLVGFGTHLSHGGFGCT